MNALAEVAAVFADPTRAAMCMALIDGRAWTVGELGKEVGVTAPSATEQVGKLAAAGFVETVRQGRHRYVRLTDARVAELIEQLTELADKPVPRPSSLRGSKRAERLAYARTCYDHLAGRLGVALRNGMLTAGLIDTGSGLALTAKGHRVLDDLEIKLPGGRRPLLKECLDWTERREHLGGSLPAALLQHAVDHAWVERGPDRSVRLLDTEAFAAFGVEGL
ncbi:helix-turn-helix transcriptional regulator [Kutzneria buriramensis]|uniref:DNA-binding transcriptional ArsR family regulator n=1 Tax=Kutzneria buriramensis TaxID=1045776 RepID=A0A3E0H019_9PSEU|nr:winged helix-turn-helix domain-containing protein [Kutzneria buriramensis]REH36149.1 DNA-binding transcriptional ArsR family regulator [Kutzneria buriramensis]